MCVAAKEIISNHHRPLKIANCSLPSLPLAFARKNGETRPPATSSPHSPSTPHTLPPAQGASAVLWEVEGKSQVNFT